jgi:hypothetical protein
MSKIDVLEGADWRPARYRDLYSLEPTTGPARLAIAPSGNHSELLLALSDVLRPPFALLYVLHTPRAATAGRYQSPALDALNLKAFVAAYGPFLAADARHDLWIRSRPDSATLVWERHDLVYAYGPIERFEDVLAGRAFHRDEVIVPTPHRHHYHADWDWAERSLLRSFDWIASPLHPEDEQPQGAV